MDHSGASKEVGILQSSRQRLAWAAGLALVAGAATVSQGAIISQYMQSGSASAATSVDPNLTASSFVPTGMGVIANDDGYSSATGGGSAYARARVLPGSETARTAYWSFTLTPTAGDQINLTSLVLSSDAVFITPQDIDGESFEVRSSLDNYASILYTQTLDWQSGDTVVPAGNLRSGPTTIDLSALPAATGPLTFRIYEYYDPFESDTPNSTGGDVVYLNKLTVNGSVTSEVPEPASLAIMGLACVGLTVCRRRPASPA